MVGSRDGVLVRWLGKVAGWRRHTERRDGRDGGRRGGGGRARG